MIYKVFLHEPASQFLASLKAEDHLRAKDLARVLLSLGKNPKPLGSRELAPSEVEQIPGSRLWTRPDWILTYRVDDAAKTVDVGRIVKNP